MCFIVNNSDNAKLRDDCLVSIPNAFTKKTDTFRNYILVKNMQYIKIPRGKCLQQFKICKTILEHPLFVDFKLSSTFDMKPEQASLVDDILKDYKQHKTINDIIVRPTAFGKTFTAINIIHQIKLKVLIVVNRDSLVQQWKKQCHTFFPNNSIGLLQGKIQELDCDIIISTVQTISLKKELSEGFINKLKIGVLILDEIHTISADKFIQVLFKANMPVRIGLTATLERIDHKEQLILQHLPTIRDLDIQEKKQQITNIHFIKTGYKFESIYLGFSVNLNFAEMLNKLSADTARNQKITTVLKTFLKEESNQILVVSDRIHQLEYLHSQFLEDSSICTSKHKPDFTKRIIFGITSIVGTGLDVPHLNVLLFAMPKKNIVQIIGRVFRKQHDMVHIIDFVDEGGIAMNQRRKRVVQYKNQIEHPTFIK